MNSVDLMAVMTFSMAVVLCMVITARLIPRLDNASILDHPNERSLHNNPIPRGGGLSIVMVTALVGVIVAVIFGDKLIAAAILAMLCLAGLGWFDDRHNLGAWIKLGAQTILAVVVVYWLGSPDTVALGALQLTVGSTGGFLIAVLWLLWIVNLYNFMDGIDGIATAQAIVAGVTLLVWYYGSGSVALCLTLAAFTGACVGFLRWNWHPARVFLGDTGSLALGGFLGVLCLGLSVNEPGAFGASVALLSVFIADASLTLAKRAWKRENILTAHKSHYYQRAVESGLSHGVVTGWFVVVAVFAALLATLIRQQQYPAILWPILLVLMLWRLAVAVRNRSQQSTTPDDRKKNHSRDNAND